MNIELLNRLCAQLPVKEREGVAGKKFKYVTSEDVIDRMNKVFEGNWRVEILEKEIIQDQILIKVRVTVGDSGNSSWAQEAYASHPLAKYTDGPKAGNFIDVGNSFRSATSKAIKAAVIRWGVGLYLDEEEDPDQQGLDSSKSSGQRNMPSYSNDTLGKSEVGKNSLPTVTPLGGAPTSKISGPNKTVLVPPLVSTKQEPHKSTSFSTAIDKKIDDKKNEFLTSVQQVAIEAIIGLHNLNYNDLLTKALQRSSDLPTSIEKMLYDDAVKVIQYGNNLRNRNS